MEGPAVSFGYSQASRSGASGDHGQSPDENLEVQPDAPVLDICRIERNVAVERRILPCLHLPQPGHAREHIELPPSNRQQSLKDLQQLFKALGKLGNVEVNDQLEERVLAALPQLEAPRPKPNP